jgi:hypothetical protein
MSSVNVCKFSASADSGASASFRLKIFNIVADRREKCREASANLDSWIAHFDRVESCPRPSEAALSEALSEPHSDSMQSWQLPSISIQRSNAGAEWALPRDWNF